MGSQRVSVEKQADMHMYCSFVKIKDVRMEDKGTYEVIAKNREGEATNTLTLNVTAKAAKDEEKDGYKLKPVPQKTKPEETVKKAAPKESAPLKISKPKEEKIKATKKVAVKNSEGPMKAIADIRMRIEHGASVNEVNAAYEAHEFPELEKVDSQMAMIKAVERVGQSASVHEVLLQECSGKNEVDLQNVGFKALFPLSLKRV